MEEKFRTGLRQQFTMHLERQRKRRTPERYFILETAMEMRGRFTADDLLQRLSADGVELRVSRATLFNTIPLLVDSGVLRRSNNRRRVDYEVVSTAAKAEPRQNLVCSVCGTVHRRKASSLREWVGAQSFGDFAPAGNIEIFVYGECGRCRRQRRRLATGINNKK